MMVVRSLGLGDTCDFRAERDAVDQECSDRHDLKSRAMHRLPSTGSANGGSKQSIGSSSLDGRQNYTEDPLDLRRRSTLHVSDHIGHECLISSGLSHELRTTKGHGSGDGGDLSQAFASRGCSGGKPSRQEASVLRPEQMCMIWMSKLTIWYMCSSPLHQAAIRADARA